MTITDEQVVKDRLDLEMLERPHLWPGHQYGARCVFIKTHDRSHTGWCMLAEELSSTPVGTYVVFDFDWASENPLKPTVTHYNKAEEIIAAGWVVD